MISSPFIEYVRGDATLPNAKPAVLVHVCNDVGAWGSGFVLSLSKRWPQPERRYRHTPDAELKLGTIQTVPIPKEQVTVINMIAQHGIYKPGHTHHQNRPLVYDALYRCLDQAAAVAKELGADLHMPKIGADRAKGDWSTIVDLITAACREHQIKAYVYIL